MSAGIGLPALPSGRYLVTGATGLVGRQVLDLLCVADIGPVTALFHNTRPQAVTARCTWQRVDLARPEACHEAFAGHDYVIHAAGLVAPGPVLARDPVGPIRANLAITGNVLEAAWRCGVRRLVWFSSTTGYPADVEELAENCMFQGDPPAQWYGLGWAHRYLEIQSRMYAERLDPALDVIALRPSLVYGPRTDWTADSAHFVYAFVRQVVERAAPIRVWGDGKQRRDLIHARDVARAALHALAFGKGYAAYNIAAGESVSIGAVLDQLLELDAWPQAKVVFDGPAGGAPGPERRFPVDLAEAELEFRPQVSLTEGLRDLIDACRADLSIQHGELRA